MTTDTRAAVKYRAILPDGTFGYRNSPTRRVYTAAVARCVSGEWSAVSFARTAELAQREAAIQARYYERHRRAIHRLDGISLPDATYVVVGVEVAP
jgi:hypothetical protein